MDVRELESLSQAMAELIDELMAPLHQRIAELETKLQSVPQKGEPGGKGADGRDGRDGIDGKDGASVAVEDVLPAIAAYVDKALLTIPPAQKGQDGRDGKDGADGKDGSSVTADDVIPTLVAQFKSELDNALATVPAPKDGKDGRDGRDGVDGENGTSVTADDVLPALSAQMKTAVASALAAIPAPSNGQDGRDGVDGRSVSLDDAATLLRAMQSEWALDFERRAQALLHGVIDRMPAAKDGKDGRDGVNGTDGLGFDDMTVEHDGRRTVTLKFARGEQRKDVALKFGVVLDSGVWKEGSFYEVGDGVTFGGSYWIAQKNTDDKPGTSDSWRLAVKKGRDGKDS